ncbi:sortase [Microbacterium sp. A1-JK]|uniref:sortase n=1 Tax=Microbacterium sp. A1-JK TaxID=3177516 RepID=UPI003883F6E9
MSVDTAEQTVSAVTEIHATTAPPSRHDGSPRPTLERGSGAVTEVIRRARTPRAPRGPSTPTRPPRAARPARSRLPLPGPRPKAPRDGRWWAGAVVLTVSLLLLSFVVHVAALSAAQHHRAQTLAYDELRTGLAKAETPVGQLVGEDEMTAVGVPVALLEAPAIGLSEVVLEGSDSDVLRSGIGHRRDSVMPGQAGTAVVLGRQLAYGGPFAQINRLVPGDEITVTTGQGANTFRVISLRRAGDPMPQPLGRGEGRLELQTADGLALFPSGVLHVDAELVSTAQQTPSRVMSYPALPPDERAMGQNDEGWFAAFFSFVFFAAAAIGVWWLWRSWGRWHAWVVGVPVLVALGVITSDLVMTALPNLL